MAIRIVADSSANLVHLKNADFVSVPMNITAEENNYVDNEELDIPAMLEFFGGYKSKSSTACPGPGDWLEAFGDAEEILVITLTSKLSGAYNSAQIAADMYLQDHPERKVYVLDSLTTGPEMQMHAEHAALLSNKGHSFEEIVEEMKDYVEHTSLDFSLATLKNFAANGRVNKALAKTVEVLHIKIVGRAVEGDLEPMNKCRGEKNAVAQLWENMLDAGFEGGKVRIRHTQNPELAKKLAIVIYKKFPECDVKIGENRGLCSYYAEPGSILVGYEKNNSTGEE